MPKVGTKRKFGLSKYAAKASRKRARKAKEKKQTIAFRNFATVGKGFPKMMKMTHKYVEVVNLVSAAGSLAAYRFSTNGLYDPNISGTGHQPYYFDQVGALYDHYCVIGSMFKIKAVNIGGASDPAFFFACFVDDDTGGVYADVDDIAEKQTGKMDVVPAGNATRTIHKTLKWSAKKYFGKNPLANTELQGTTSANPTEQSYFWIGAQANAAGNVTVSVTVEITYIAIWKEVKDVAQS